MKGPVLAASQFHVCEKLHDVQLLDLHVNTGLVPRYSCPLPGSGLASQRLMFGWVRVMGSCLSKTAVSQGFVCILGSWQGHVDTLSLHHRIGTLGFKTRESQAKKGT